MKLKYLACTMLASTISVGAAHAQTTINAGGSSLAFPTYSAEFAAYTKANPSILFSYAAVGSGSGQAGFLNNAISDFYPLPAGDLSYGTPEGSQVDIGASDAVLTSANFTNPLTGSYANSPTDGPLIQIPTLGVPVAIAFNESGAKKLTLTDAQVCGVLSGKITDWNTLVPSIPAGTTIEVTYRSDGSGTTFLVTQHLNAVCNKSNSSFPTLPVPVTKTFTALFAGGTIPSNFTGESGSGAVANNLVNTANSLGYLSPDYTSIAPKSANVTTLAVASLVNGVNSKAYLPTVANTITGLANAGAGQSDATPPNSPSTAMDPLNWVPTVPVANAGYPIVGYTTMDLSTCYASKTAAKAIQGFLKDQYSNASYKTIIENNGFAPLANTKAVKYVTAVLDTFLSNDSGYKLNIENPTICASYPGR